MYIPTAFREEDQDQLLAFMEAHSFATLISVQEGLPVVSHIPLVVKRCDQGISLIGHLAKANPHWQAFDSHESLAVFTGPHAYISPTLYEGRENVPTWNYIAVHAYGVPQMITLRESREQMEAMIDGMVDAYEATYKSQWHSLSDGYREGMMNGIVGFEMPITRLEGKYKLSQNRSHPDQQHVAQALLHYGDADAQAIGLAMQQNLENG